MRVNPERRDVDMYSNDSGVEDSDAKAHVTDDGRFELRGPGDEEWIVTEDPVSVDP